MSHGGAYGAYFAYHIEEVSLLEKTFKGQAKNKYWSMLVYFGRSFKKEGEDDSLFCTYRWYYFDRSNPEFCNLMEHLIEGGVDSIPNGIQPSVFLKKIQTYFNARQSNLLAVVDTKTGRHTILGHATGRKAKQEWCDAFYEACNRKARGIEEKATVADILGLSTPEPETVSTPESDSVSTPEPDPDPKPKSDHNTEEGLMGFLDTIGID